MKQLIKKIILITSSLSILAVPLLAPVAVHAQSKADIQGNLCAGSNLDVNVKTCDQVEPTGQKVNDLIGTVINIFSVVVGVVAVIMIIIGGLRYVTSGGDSGNVGNAKNTILYAIIGLVVVALAQIVVKFVLAKTFSTPT